jgi:membrane protein involved in colicin uptake
MPVISEETKKAQERAQKTKNRADAIRQAEKLATANARAKGRADRNKAEAVLGKAILAVNDAGDITPDELALIGRVAHRWKKPSADFYLIADLKPPEGTKAVRDEVLDAAAE